MMMSVCSSVRLFVRLSVAWNTFRTMVSGDDQCMGFSKNPLLGPWPSATPKLSPCPNDNGRGLIVSIRRGDISLLTSRGDVHRSTVCCRVCLFVCLFARLLVENGNAGLPSWIFRMDRQWVPAIKLGQIGSKSTSHNQTSRMTDSDSSHIHL